MSSTKVIHGEQIAKKFVSVVQWARGGSLTIITPFINDFEIGTVSVSARIMGIARMNSRLILIVAPPDKPHRTHANGEQQSCGACVAAAKKILLLDRYSKFAEDIRIKNNLHAKVYIAIDGKGIPKCLTGSVNLTRQAFNVLCELGIYTSDKLIIEQIRKIIRLWVREKTVPAQEYRTWRRAFLDEYPPVKDLVEKRLV
jgi:phosphatidylserine/phosphatidylglycerophosphate/cardiolipin synthase-like enzyme